MKKKTMISLLLVSSIALGTTGCGMVSGRSRTVPATQTATVQQGDLVRTVLASGLVESADPAKVYAPGTNYAVAEISVKVGEAVKKGDVLGVLDTTALALEISQTKLNLKNAEAALETEIQTLEYNRTSAANNLESARLDRNEKKDAYEAVRESHDEGKVSDDALDQAKHARDKAQLAYDNAKANLALMESKTTQVAENNIEIQKATLEKQTQLLNDSTITSPRDGIVTAVNAKLGGPANGLLFVIEDPSDLIVATAIGEYDIHSVKTGQTVQVRADGTGNKIYPGTIAAIAPTALKNAEGDAASSANVQFETVIALSEPDDSIRIGMNVQLTIELEESQAAFYIPYDALGTEADGSHFIELVDAGEAGSDAVVRKLQVEKGLETDLYTEIRSPELAEGMTVQLNASQVTE